MQRFKKQSFVLTAHTCFKNVGVTRMYVVAGFRMLFDRGVNVFVGSGLVLGPRLCSKRNYKEPKVSIL